MKLHKNDFSGYILRGIVLALFSLTVLYMLTIYNLGFHSDMASANMLAREQMRTGQWFPETWNYATGISIFSPFSLINPLSIFTDNQVLLHNLAVLILLIVFLILLCYLSKRILGSDFYLVFLCFFFSNTSSMVRDMAFVDAAYLTSITYAVLLLILLTKTFDENFAIKSRRWLAGLMLFVAFISLYGTLNLAYLVIPLIGAIVAYFVLEHWNSPFASIKKALFRWTKAIVAIMASVIVGYFGYRELVAYTGFDSVTNDVSYPANSTLANQFVQFILNAIGYRTKVKLFSLSGIMNAVILLVFLAVVVCCVLLFIKYREQPFAVKMLMLFGLFENVILIYFDFTIYCMNIGEIRYFFRPLIFMWLLAAYYIYTYVLSKGFVLKMTVIVALCAFSAPYMLSNIPQVTQYAQARGSQMGLVNFLKENNLKHGYATYWNAGKNMVLSDFDIEIGGVRLDNTIRPFYWLSSDISYDPDAYSGESFLLLTQSENSTFANSYGMQILGEPQEILTYGSYTMYVYPYNIAENGFQGRRYYNVELIDHMHVSDSAMAQTDGTISIAAGQVAYGPYIELVAGSYEVEVEFEQLDVPVLLYLTSDNGKNLLLEQELHENKQTIYFETVEQLSNFETVFRVFDKNGSAVLYSVKITQIVD